ncbi:MAG: hypothetical protein EXS28_00020 [Pedosphaera sp.]|nr:hypothetical protein [Pedosphaera sp.]
MPLLLVRDWLLAEVERLLFLRATPLALPRVPLELPLEDPPASPAQATNGGAAKRAASKNFIGTFIRQESALRWAFAQLLFWGIFSPAKGAKEDGAR